MNDEYAKDMAFYMAYLELKDGQYLSTVVAAIQRRIEKERRRLEDAADWNDYQRIRGELNGLRAALSELQPQNPQLNE